MGIRISSDRESESERQNNGMDNAGYENSDKRDRNAVPLFSEVNNIYTYQEDEDVELFVNPIVRSGGKWKQEFRVVRYFRFWAAVVTWIGMKAGSLYFWILVPVVFLQRNAVSSVYHSNGWVTLLVVAGLGSFVPSIASCWSITIAAQYRRIYFGIACWLGSIILLGVYIYIYIRIISRAYFFRYYSIVIIKSFILLCDILITY